MTGALDSVMPFFFSAAEGVSSSVRRRGRKAAVYATTMKLGTQDRNGFR